MFTTLCENLIGEIQAGLPLTTIGQSLQSTNRNLMQANRAGRVFEKSSKGVLQNENIAARPYHVEKLSKVKRPRESAVTFQNAESALHQYATIYLKLNTVLCLNVFLRQAVKS